MTPVATRAAIVCAVVCSWSGISEAQTARQPLTAATLRKLTADALAEAKSSGDPLELLDKKLEERLGEPIAKEFIPVSYECGKIYAMIQGPYAAYRLTLSERLRKMEPVGLIPLKSTDDSRFSQFRPFPSSN